MQINSHRVKKVVAFLCGLCLSVSFWFNRGLITNALPAYQYIPVILDDVGMLTMYSGALDSSRKSCYYNADYIDITNYDSLYLESFSFSGTSNKTMLNAEPYNLYYMCYDSNKSFLGWRQFTGSVSYNGSSSPYNFTATINGGSFNFYSNTKYIRFTMRNLTGNNNNDYNVFYSSPIEYRLRYTYDDGSFNVGIYGDSGVRFPLNVSGAYNPDYEEGATGWLYGSQILLSGSANSTAYSSITLNGFEKAYYDIDLYINIDLDATIRELNDFHTGVSKYNNNLDMPYVECGYPSVHVTSIPDGLNYNISQNHINGRAIKYTAKNAWSSGMKLEWDTYKNDTQSTCLLHVYGTVYISNELTIPLLYTANVTCRNFPQFAYIDTSDLLRFGLDYSVNGIVQKSPHTFGSEIEGLETINESINNQTNEMIKEHEEEIQKGEETSSELESSLENVKSNLTAIEILKLPWTMLQDLYNAVIADGVTSLTFPSFELMGYKLWDEYVFDLSSLDSSFPVLFKSVRLITGFLICFAFGNYIRSYFTRLFGGDVEVD